MSAQRLIYVDENGKLVTTTDPQIIAEQLVMQELGLWCGENPMAVNRGVDYMGVLEGNVFLKQSVEMLCDRYKDKFESIVVGDVESIELKGGDLAYKLDILFYKTDGTITERTIKL